MLHEEDTLEKAMFLKPVCSGPGAGKRKRKT
jgi:hypothetical protein